MPWTVRSAKKHNRKAGKRWVRIANRVLKDTGDEGRAIRIASGVIKKKRKIRITRKKH
ncbi:MAG TPA: hypothetical protein VNA25_26755 [Phycisphaerae bacterium]|nr:hypothetical protein [Phycisphaerae bacterium]